MTISISSSDLPSSDWYTGSGATNIILDSAQEIIVNTKKNLIKMSLGQSDQSQLDNPSDKGKNFVKDLKRVQDTIKIRGWLNKLNSVTHNSC